MLTTYLYSVSLSFSMFFYLLLIIMKLILYSTTYLAWSRMRIAPRIIISSILIFICNRAKLLRLVLLFFYQKPAIIAAAAYYAAAGEEEEKKRYYPRPDNSCGVVFEWC